MGVTLTESWSCMDCEEHGSGPGSDRAAAKHTEKAKHATRSMSVPTTLGTPKREE